MTTYDNQNAGTINVIYYFESIRRNFGGDGVIPIDVKKTTKKACLLKETHLFYRDVLE